MAENAAEKPAIAREAHPDYWVLRRLDVTREWPVLEGAGVLHAVVLDRSSAKLEHIAYQYGYFFEWHRPEIDCRATPEILREPFADTDATVLNRLLASAREPSLRIWALASPFETRDVLKARGYRWEGEKRVWRSKRSTREQGIRGGTGRMNERVRV
jgi:hypothetical protein